MIKKLLFTLMCLMTSVGAFAQAKTFELGIKLNCATEDPHLGFGAVARYNIDGHFRPEFEANYYPEGDNNIRAWDVNMNLQYLFPITHRFKVYPTAGLTIVGADFDGIGISTSESRVGLNLGGGVQFNITPKLHLHAETVYKIVSDIDRGVLSVGLSYAF
ncbi:MAG: porin family protein [Prevotella salivae]|uniref:porin family protein n=1 Tax=Segatella salivae TaxID=228604 RepID=UPI001CAB8041|nr:porin family protein [Segatella salivae]MBF1523122.1 porin family protein [Segatella salivae]